MEGKEITEAYVRRGKELDEYLMPDSPGTVANWFHFAAWGTYSVNLMSQYADPEIRASLMDAMGSTYDDIEQETEKFLSGAKPSDTDVGRAFLAYGMVNQPGKVNDAFVRTDTRRNLVRLANLMLATREQKLLQKPLDLIFSQLPESMTDLMVLIFPGKILKPPQPWNDFHVRMPWIIETMNAHLTDPGIQTNPYETAKMTSLEMLLISAANGGMGPGPELT